MKTGKLPVLLVLLFFSANAVAQVEGSFSGFQARWQGGILGRVYLDLDDDGKFSDGDRGLGGVRILTDCGLQATTDAEGRFHIHRMLSGHELLAGHLVKIDPSTVPAGLLAKPSARRLVHLSPLVMERVDFSLLPAKAKTDDAPGVTPAGEDIEPVVRLAAGGEGLVTRLAGRAPAACSVFIDGKSVEIGPEGIFSELITVHKGANPHLIVVQCTDGRAEFLLATLHWVSRKEGGDLLVPAALQQLAVCRGPAGVSVPHTSSIALACVLQPGVSMTIGDISVSAKEDSAQQARFILPAEPGLNVQRAEITRYRTGDRPLSGTLSWRVSRTRISGAVLGSVVYSYGDGVGYFGGRLRGQMRAKLPVGFKLILGGGLELIDKEGVSVGDVLGPAWNPWINERSPDPETSYSMHADRALVTDANPAASRYYLRLERKSSLVGWGAYALEEGRGWETGHYTRALLGAHASIRPLEDLFAGPRPPVDLKLEGFFAQPQQAKADHIPSLGLSRSVGRSHLPAHEEFLATGGTLYFLAHEWLVEGSAGVQIQHRDARTGMILDGKKLRPGLDYQVDVLAGRIILTQPAGLHQARENAVRLFASGSTDTILVVDYEYIAEAAEGVDMNLAGGRSTLSVRPAEGISISGAFTGVVQGFDDAFYRLYKGAARLSLEDVGQVWASYSRSQGRALTPAYSVDGGVSFAGAPFSERDAGEAYEAGARLDLKWLKGRLSFRRWLDGYSDTSLAAGSDLTQGLLSLTLTPVEKLDITGRFSGTEHAGGDVASRLWEGSLGVVYRVLPELRLAAQGVFDMGDDQGDGGLFGQGRRVVAGLRATYRVCKWLELLAAHQHTMTSSGDGPASRDLTLSSAGGRLYLPAGIALGVEGGWGHDLGNQVSLSLEKYSDSGELTFAETTFSVDGPAQGTARVSSGQSVAGEDGMVFTSSSTMGRTRGLATQGQQIAVDIPLKDAWRAKLAYTRSELQKPADEEFRRDHFLSPFFDRGLTGLTRPGRRNAVFARLGYVTPRLSLSASGEYRVDEHLPLALDTGLGPGEENTGIDFHRQTVLTLAAFWALSDDLHLGGRVAWAETFGSHTGSNGPGIPAGGMLEASLGLAWRPAEVDWLRLMFRAAAGKDNRPAWYQPEAVSRLLETWLSATAVVMMRPIKYLQPTLVLAPWYNETTSVPGAPDYHADDFGLLGMLRLSSEIVFGLGLSAELRLGWRDNSLDTFPAPEGQGFEVGYAGEVFYELRSEDAGALRLGVGYSFSDLPDPLMRLPDLRTGRRGVFVRLEGAL